MVDNGKRASTRSGGNSKEDPGSGETNATDNANSSKDNSVIRNQMQTSYCDTCHTLL